jgi:hypothetical protein
MAKSIYVSIIATKEGSMTIQTMSLLIKTKLLSLLVITVLLAGCVSSQESISVELTTEPPTAPTTLPEAIEGLSSYSAETRITAIYSLPRFGEEAVIAVPLLIQNLQYETTSDVREAAAIILGEFGLDARSAVPELINVLQNDVSVNVRSAAAEALGQIGDSAAIPTLVDILYEKETQGLTNPELSINSARSIALITGQNFPDVDGEHGYQLNEQNVPLIVIAAQEWWETEGKFQKWGGER